jgi:hypothetical protein
MRIFVVRPQFPDSFARSVAVALEQMGFRVSTGFPELIKGFFAVGASQRHPGGGLHSHENRGHWSGVCGAYHRRGLG